MRVTQVRPRRAHSQCVITEAFIPDVDERSRCISYCRPRTRVARVKAEYPDQLDYSGRRGFKERVASNSALTRDMQLS